MLKTDPLVMASVLYEQTRIAVFCVDSRCRRPRGRWHEYQGDVVLLPIDRDCWSVPTTGWANTDCQWIRDPFPSALALIAKSGPWIHVSSDMHVAGDGTESPFKLKPSQEEDHEHRVASWATT